MASASDLDKRHVYGPRAVGALLPPLIRPAFRRRNPAAARIVSDWEAIVGPVLAGMTVPRRLSAGTLVIGCSGPMALELQHLSDRVVERINTHLGSTAVARIRMVQEAFAATAAPPSRPTDTPATLAAAERAVAPVPDGPLRESLLRLGRRVLARPG